MESDQNRLIEEIFASFRCAPYPGDDLIVNHDCEECREIKDAFKGKSPDQIAADIVHGLFDSISFLSADARRYYLPMFLRESIRQPDSMVTNFLLYSLADCASESGNWQPSGGYSKEQVESVLHYLDYIHRPYGEMGARSRGRKERPSKTAKLVEESRAGWMTMAEPSLSPGYASQP